MSMVSKQGLINPRSGERACNSVGLGGFCSKKALLCYAAIPMRKLYHAQHKVEYAHTMLGKFRSM